MLRKTHALLRKALVLSQIQITVLRAGGAPNTDRCQASVSGLDVNDFSEGNDIMDRLWI